ncbi:MAG: hypothetical protein GX921_10750 [Bacteroidales bacterium]|nr:hypothetical protein [Bacteroidales bacterium]
MFTTLATNVVKSLQENDKYCVILVPIAIGTKASLHSGTGIVFAPFLSKIRKQEVLRQHYVVVLFQNISSVNNRQGLIDTKFDVEDYC